MFSFEILRNKDFRIMAMVRMFAAMALQAQDVIIGWQIYSLTHDPFMLGLVGLAEAVPALACALFAGHVVDISRPYRIFRICILAMALNMSVLYLIAGGVIAAPGGKVVAWMFAGVFFSGLVRSFLMPSSFALFPQIVPRASIPSASAWMTGGFQVGVIGGPAIAGLIYGLGGPHAAWTFPLGLMGIAVFAVYRIGKSHHDFRNSAVREPAVKSIKAGWAFIFRTPALLSVMALDMFAVLFGGAVAMLPAYADQVLHVGSSGLGALRAAPAVGAVAMTLWLAMRPFKEVRARKLLWAVAGFGLCIIGFGFSHWFWLSMLFLMLSGATDSISMVMRQTLVQWLTPDAMRGRVSSVNSMFIISSNEIGAFESGLAAKLLGLVPSIVFGGVGTLIVVAITAFASPKLRRLVVRAEEIPG